MAYKNLIIALRNNNSDSGISEVYSDDFNRVSLGANWTVPLGTVGITSNQLEMQDLNGAYAIYTGTAIGSVDRAIYFNLQGIISYRYPHVVLRYTDDSSPLYTVEFSPVYGVTWYSWDVLDGTSTSIQSLSGAGLTGDETFGITIEGTGSDTVIRIWRNVVNTVPVSFSEWDPGDTTPDYTFTNDPGGNAVDTGDYVGFGGYGTNDSILYDNLVVSENLPGSPISIGSITIPYNDSVNIWDTVSFDSASFDNFAEVKDNIGTFNEYIGDGYAIMVRGTDLTVQEAWDQFQELLGVFNQYDFASAGFSILRGENEETTGLDISGSGIVELYPFSLSTNDAFDLHTTAGTYGGIIIPYSNLVINRAIAYLEQTAAGTFQVGIWSIDGNTRIGLSSATDTSGAVGFKETLFSSSILLTAGTPYYVGIAANASGTRFAATARSGGTWGNYKPCWLVGSRVPSTISPSISTTLPWIGFHS